MADGDLFALLDRIAANAEGGCVNAPEDCIIGDTACTYCEALACVRALRAVLGAADDARPDLFIPPADCTDECATGPCRCSGKSRPVAWSLDPATVRKVIAIALTGKEAGDGQAS